MTLTVEQLTEKIRALHRPFGIYDECDHEHTDEDLAAGRCLEVDEVGLTCDDGLLYQICEECCTVDLGWTRQQREGCAESHDHSKTGPICKTIQLLEEIQ